MGERGRLEAGDRVKVKAKDGKWLYGTLGRTDRHRIEWFVRFDDARHGCT